MGKVEDASFNLFVNPGESGNVGGLNDENGRYLSNDLSTALTPDAYKGNLFFEQGRYARLNLLSANNQRSETNGVGGYSRVSADSSPPQFLKDPRVRAMLDVIGYAEGTGNNYGRVVFGRVVGGSDRSAPYNHALVGKRNVVVRDFRRHPNLAVHWADGQPTSSAAGRYQFLYSTWKGLNMPDFSPRSQDLAAIKLMQRRGMIEPLLRDDFAGAIHKGAPEWASLPTSRGGSYYGGQGAKTLNSLRGVYSKSLSRYQGTNPPPPSSSKPNTHHILARGQHGRAVDALQDRLIRLGVMTEKQKKTGPGIFGPRTEAAVKKFQKAVGLKESGRYDEATQKAMHKILAGDVKKGAKGAQVLQMQEHLVRLGYITQAKVNTGRGIFGPKTDAALRWFQREHNLTPDGIFGPKTFDAMRTAQPRKTENNSPKPPTENGRVYKYDRWNVYSTGERPARLADGYEDLQAHHDYQSVGYVMRGLQLKHRLEARDVVLTRVGESNFGQRIPSPISGKVLFAGNEGDGYGNKVVVKNEKTGQVVLLGHLESLNVRRGETVAYGQTVGEQGSTGNSTGAHIHINADSSVIKRWVADLADGKFDGVRARFDIGRRP
jgi:peptidoglycan hydrolase-like protein with peptidoglycan-binding domain/muramidase (phage lysozyme)